jgi:hypothetical protein
LVSFCFLSNRRQRQLSKLGSFGQLLFSQQLAGDSLKNGFVWSVFVFSTTDVGVSFENGFVWLVSKISTMRAARMNSELLILITDFDPLAVTILFLDGLHLGSRYR